MQDVARQVLGAAIHSHDRLTGRANQRTEPFTPAQFTGQFVAPDPFIELELIHMHAVILRQGDCYLDHLRRRPILTA